MEKRPNSLHKLQNRNSLSQIEPPELSDILNNKGVLQEANRTFFHPLGLALTLSSDDPPQLELKKSVEGNGGPVIESIDRMALQAYRNYSESKFDERQSLYGFIIQVRDLLRVDQLVESITDPAARRLSFILKALDEMVYKCKAKLIEQSPDKDKKVLAKLDEVDLGEKLTTALGKANWVNAMYYLFLLANADKLNKKIENLRSRETDPEDLENMKARAKEMGLEVDSMDKGTLKKMLRRNSRDQRNL